MIGQLFVIVGPRKIAEHYMADLGIEERPPSLDTPRERSNAVVIAATDAQDHSHVLGKLLGWRARQVVVFILYSDAAMAQYAGAVADVHELLEQLRPNLTANPTYVEVIARVP